MACDLPQQRGGHAADQRVADAQAPDRHHEVDRGQDQDLAGQAEQVEQHARHAVQRPAAPEQLDTFLPDHLQAAGDQRGQEHADAERQDVEIGHQRRDHEVAAPNLRAVQKDHRHRAFEHRERERAEEQHRRQQHPADQLAVGEKVRQLGDDRA